MDRPMSALDTAVWYWTNPRIFMLLVQKMSVLLFLFSVRRYPRYLENKIKQELLTGGLNMQFVMGEGNISGQYNFFCNPDRSRSIATLHDGNNDLVVEELFAQECNRNL